MSGGNQAGMMEAMESRRMLAVTMTYYAPDTLLFSGDGQMDTVNINDNGDGMFYGSANNADGVLVPFGPIWGIDHVVVHTQGSDDRVNYTVYGDVPAGSERELYVDLGAGNDRFQFFAGNDIDLAALGSHIEVKVLGKWGNDFMWAFYRGKLDGSLSLEMDGGLDDDRLITDVRADAGSLGVLNASSKGQDGSDTIEMLVRKSSPYNNLVSITASVSGGNGSDVVTRTSLVRNDSTCEVLNVIP